jgi:biopolymer transport protein ExbB/TolQ
MQTEYIIQILIAFIVIIATTVVGLVVNAIGLISLQFKQGWYAKDVNNLDYVARLLTTKQAKKKHETPDAKKK